MKERAAELRAEGKKGAKKADGLQAVLGARGLGWAALAASPLMAGAALVEDGRHQAHHLVDAPGRHRLAVAAPPLGDLGLEAEQVPAVDHGQRLVAKAGQDDRVEGLADLGAVLGAPAGAGLDDPELGEFGEGGGGVVAFGRGRGRRVVTVESLGTRAVGEEGGVVESPAPDLGVS